MLNHDISFEKNTVYILKKPTEQDLHCFFFLRSQLIRIHTDFHSAGKKVLITTILLVSWVKIMVGEQYI